MRKASQSAFANPVMVGAVTVLGVLVALFLAYNAGQGLPFVPTRELKVNIVDGADIAVGNDVREGGFRIGLVSDVHPIKDASGKVIAQLILKLDKANGMIPIDSKATVLARSILGLKYLDLERGTSTQVFPDGGVLPVYQTTVPVQFDDVFSTFNKKTRTAVQRSLTGTGDVLAGRGSNLNDTIASLPRLLGYLEPVAKQLSDPRTGLTRFLGDLNGFLSTLAPLTQVNIRLFGEAATTFAAIDRNPTALERTIAESPSTLATSIDSLRAQQPFLADLTTLGHNLTPATADLRDALPDINPAIEAGTRTLVRTTSLNANLQRVMTSLKELALAPGTNVAINALNHTVRTLNPVIRYVGPYQTVCDDWNYWWTYFADHVSQPTQFGFAQRVLLNIAAPGTNSVNVLGATAPANGESGSDTSLSTFTGGAQFLHAQPYGAAIDNQGNADCETGQRGYPKKLNFFDPQHRNLGTDVHTPGNQGPTFNGRARVPAGETFSRSPQIGPMNTPNPSNP